MKGAATAGGTGHSPDPTLVKALGELNQNLSGMKGQLDSLVVQNKSVAVYGSYNQHQYPMQSMMYPMQQPMYPMQQMHMNP